MAGQPSRGRSSVDLHVCVVTGRNKKSRMLRSMNEAWMLCSNLGMSRGGVEDCGFNHTVNCSISSRGPSLNHNESLHGGLSICEGHIQSRFAPPPCLPACPKWQKPSSLAPASLVTAGGNATHYRDALKEGLQVACK